MKQPLLLLHGAISSKKQFDVLLPHLQNRFEVHAHDFPGHGGTEIPNEPFSIRLFVESVIGYLDSKRIPTLSLFGYSMGGYVALYLARYHPDRVKKVFTLATKMEWPEQIAVKESAQLNPEKISEKVPTFASALEQIHFPQDWKKVLDKTSAMLLHLGKNPDLTKTDFPQIEIPVTISIGDLDKMVSIDESRNAANNLKNGRLLVLPSTPHPFGKVNHEKLAEHIFDFFIQI